jgi:hypothetical protein
VGGEGPYNPDRIASGPDLWATRRHRRREGGKRGQKLEKRKEKGKGRRLGKGKREGS